MATTTDTLIFEFKTQDDVSDVFKSLKKDLTSLGKEAEESFDKVGKAMTKSFEDIMSTDLSKIFKFDGVEGLFISSFTGIVGKVGSLLLDGFGGIFDGIIRIAGKAFDLIGDGVEFVVDKALEGIDAFGDFEQGMKEIEKSAGGTQKELESLGDSIRDAVIFELKGKKTVEQLQEIAAMSGKFGIATKDLDVFSVSVAKMSDLWDLTVSKTGESAAKLISQYKLSASQIENVGSVVDGVADSFATSESFLLNFMQRVSGVAVITKQSIGDMAGLAGVVAVETGMAAQAASSSFQKIMGVMMDDYAAFAGEFGIQTSEMKRIIETDGAMAFEMLLEHLTKISQEQGPTAAVAAMKELGIAGINNERLLLGLIGKTDLLRDAQAKANQFFQDGTRISENYAKSIDSQNAGFAQWQAVMDEVSLTIGEVLSPAVSVFQDILANNVIPVIMDLVEWFRESNEASLFFGAELPALLAELGEYFQVLLEKAVEFGKSIDWSAILEKISDWFQKISDKIYEFIRQITDGKGLMESFLSTFPELGGVVGSIQGIIDVFKEIFQSIKDTTQSMKDSGVEWRDVFDAIGIAIDATVNTIKDMFDVAMAAIDAFMSAWDLFEDAFSSASDFIKPLGDSIQKAFSKSVEWVGKAVNAVKKLKDAITGANEAQEEFEETGTGNSTWPDMNEWVGKNINSVDKLSSEVASGTQALSQMGNMANMVGSQISSQMTQAANAISQTYASAFGAVGGTRTATPFEMASLRPANQLTAQYRQPAATQTTQVQQASSGVATRQPAPVINNFNGINAIDPSSQNRLVRTITRTQRRTSLRSVRS